MIPYVAMTNMCLRLGFEPPARGNRGDIASFPKGQPHSAVLDGDAGGAALNRAASSAEHGARFRSRRCLSPSPPANPHLSKIAVG